MRLEYISQGRTAASLCVSTSIPPTLTLSYHLNSGWTTYTSLTMSSRSGFKIKINTTNRTASSSQKRKASDSSPIVEDTSRAGDKKQRTQLFREVAEGKGGIYTLTKNGPQHIGTRGLITCLGIYFAISDSQCFFAHVNFNIMGLDGKRRKPIEFDHFAMDNEELKKAVRITMKECLDEVLANMPVTQRMRNTLVMVSPASGSPEKVMIADVLAQAVRRFLKIPKADRGNVEYAVQKRPSSNKPLDFMVHHNGPSQGGRFADVLISESLEAEGWTGVVEGGEKSFATAAIRADGMTMDVDGVWEFEADENDVSDDDDA